MRYEADGNYMRYEADGNCENLICSKLPAPSRVKLIETRPHPKVAQFTNYASASGFFESCEVDAVGFHSKLEIFKPIQGALNEHLRF